MQKLYSKATGVLRIAGEHTDQFPVEKGIRQGWVLSPMLFNTCEEMIMRMLESEISERAGYIIGGRSVWNLRYADDTTLNARSCNELQQQVSAIENISAQFVLTINATKTHMMVIDAESDADQVITIAGKAIGRVERFKFLGSIVTNDSNSSTEINVRLAIARQVMRQLTEIWKSAEISLKLKKQLVKSLVWSIALYGSESWAVKKCDEKRITAFELWVVLETCAAYQLDWIQDQCLGAAEDWRTGAEWATWTAEKTEVGQIWALEEKKWGAGYGCDRGESVYPVDGEQHG